MIYLTPEGHQELDRIRAAVEAQAREAERRRHVKSRVWDITVQERFNGEMMRDMSAGKRVQDEAREAGAGD